jgi:DNA-binding GntR family transcriptional regulator
MKPDSNSLLKRKTVADSVAEYITSKIVTGAYPGGSPVRQEAIAAELGVSRIPVREALLQLEAEGLIVNRPHRGAVVADLSVEDAIELFDARVVLEPHIVKVAIANLTDADLTSVSAILKEYEEGVAGHRDPAELSRLNWAFHAALLEPARRPRTMALIQTLYHSADRYLRLQIEPLTAQSKALDEHRVIFDAYSKRDASLTSRLLKAHIRDAAEDIIQQIEKIYPRRR